MKSPINQAIQAATQITMEKLEAYANRMVASSAEPRRKSFVQWLDFSQQGHVYHLHVQYLEWLYGSVYRKHTRHILLLYNFDVNGTGLKPQHKDALDYFTALVVRPHFINGTRGRAKFTRHFEDYANPFAVNVSAAQKHSLILAQPWAGTVSRDDALKYQETERYVDGRDLRAPYDEYDIFFPQIDPATTLQELSASEAAQFVDGGIGNSNNSVYMPFAIDKLLMLGPAPNTDAYPFQMIKGHASATGPEEQNDTLSEQRAEAVASWLHTRLSEECAEFDHINPDLRANVSAEGSEDPIWDAPGEVDENRSVQIVFETAYDGIDLMDSEQLREQCEESIKGLDTLLKESLTTGKRWLQASRNNQAYTPNDFWEDGKSKGRLNRSMRLSDQRVALANSLLKFCRSYQGDFKTLKQDSGGTAGLPAWGQVSDAFKYDLHITDQNVTQPMLPIPFILQHGSYERRKGPDFHLPVSTEDRVRLAVVELERVLKQYSAESITHLRDVLMGQFTLMGEIYQRHYATFYARNAITAHSFLMTELPDKAAFESAVDNQTLNLQVKIDGQWHPANLVHYAFYSSTMKDRASDDGPWYWYDQDLLSFVDGQKAALADTVVKVDEIYKTLERRGVAIADRRLTYEPTGTNLEDLYYYMEIHFFIGLMK